MTTERRVKLLINKQKLTQKKFAQSIGISPARLNNYFAGISNIPTDLIVKIAQLYNVDLNWLMNGPGSDPIYNEPARARDPADLIQIPVVADIAAGTGIDAFDVEPDEYLDISRHLIPFGKKLLAFRVLGNSMEPFICPGDYAVVNTNWHDRDLQGFICAVRTASGLVLKRYVLDTKNRACLLIPLNPSHPIIHITDDDPEYTIVGILILVIRKFP